MSKAARVLFWSRTQRVTWLLLMAWLLVNLGVPWFARGLDRWQLFGFPFGYWLAAQGALLLFLVIIVIDVWVMERLEARLRDDAGAAAEPPPAGPP